MDVTIEITNRLASPKSCNALLYTPTHSGMTCIETRVYELESAPSKETARRLASEILADPVSDDIHISSSPAVSNWSYYIDISLKRGLLDLEREYLMKYLRGDTTSNLAPGNLRVVRRIYFFGEDRDLPPERILKDVVNPVIHTWKIHHA